MLSSSSFDQIARVLKYTVWKKKIPSLALRSHDKRLLNYDDNEIINILTETLINFSSITAYSRLTTFCKKITEISNELRLIRVIGLYGNSYVLSKGKWNSLLIIN